MRKPALILLTILISACQATPIASPTSSAPPTVAPTDNASVQPATAPPPSALPPTAAPPSTAPDWEKIADIGPFRNLQLDEIAWTGTRFVASGGRFMLDSDDGRTWHLGQRIDAFDFLEFGVGPQGVVAVAGDGAWFSPDGLAWTPARRTSDVEAANGRLLKLSGVVATDDGWLAAGSDAAECPFTCGPDFSTPVIWRSSDGLTWSREATTGLGDQAEITSMARTERGFVAVGDAVSGRRIHAAVWLSADGRKWTRVQDSDVFGAPAGLSQFFVWMTDVVSTPKVIVAVGIDFVQDTGGSALAWYSTDGGATWQRATGERFPDGQIFAVAEIPGRGFVATGPSGRTSCLGGIWLSADGTSWKCVADTDLFKRFAAYAAAASPTDLVVVGFGGGTDHLEATAYLHDLDSLPGLR